MRGARFAHTYKRCSEWGKILESALGIMGIASCWLMLYLDLAYF